MNSAKSLELRTCEVVCPTTGVSRSARNLTACTSEKTQSTQWGEGGHPVCVPLASHTVEVFAPLSFSGVYTPYQGVDQTASGSSMCCSFSSPRLVLGPFPVGDTCSHPSASSISFHHSLALPLSAGSTKMFSSRVRSLRAFNSLGGTFLGGILAQLTAPITFI